MDTGRLKLAIRSGERICYLARACEDGMSSEEVYDLTKIDKWFLRNLAELVVEDRNLRNMDFQSVHPAGLQPTGSKAADNVSAGRRDGNAYVPLFRAKKLGFSDRQLAIAFAKSEEEIRRQRKIDNLIPTYRLVDTCAAEF